MRTCKTHRQYQHTHTSSSYPPPLWNGAFCTLGCKTQSAHEAVANITLCVGPAFHGETIPLGGGVPPHWQNLELEHIYIFIYLFILIYSFIYLFIMPINSLFMMPMTSTPPEIALNRLPKHGSAAARALSGSAAPARAPVARRAPRWRLWAPPCYSFGCPAA